jgi:hypothetical protein
MGRSASGRMINQDIALSSKVASLSPEALALFCLLIPHYNPHGKMLANPYSIKGSVCPLVEWLTVEKVEKCLVEISEKTNVKWWCDDRGLFYLHSLTWKEHQNLREDRLGPDHLPDYPGENTTTPGPLPDKSRTTPAKGKGREEKKEEKKSFSSDSLRLSGLLANLIAENNLQNRSVQPGTREQSIQGWAVDIDRMLRLDSRTPEETEEVIRWCQEDSFWRSNILSASSLRKQFDKLTLQMQDNNRSEERAPLAVAGRRIY